MTDTNTTSGAADLPEALRLSNEDAAMLEQAASMLEAHAVELKAAGADSASAALPDAPEALQLKSCPCGATPTALQITGDEQAKWAHVSGNCCGEWEIEYRNNYTKLASTEAMTLATAAWNEAPRPSHWQAPASKIDGLTAAQESLGVEFEKVLHDNLFDLYEESAAQQEAQTPAHIKAMERAWLWMDNQADSQSKGGHATFDLMMLREERDALRAALDAAQIIQPAPQQEAQEPVEIPAKCPYFGPSPHRDVWLEGWYAACATKPAPKLVERKPLPDSWIRSMCAQPWVFDTVKQWVRITEAAHGIKGGEHDQQ